MTRAIAVKPGGMNQKTGSEWKRFDVFENVSKISRAAVVEEELADEVPEAEKEDSGIGRKV